VSRPALLAVATLILCACVSTNTTMLVPPQKYAAVPEDSVEVFLSEQELKDKGYQYERVALIYATGSSEYTSESGMVKKLRHDAGQRGANGIVLNPIHEPGAGAKIAGALFGIGTQRKGEVVAVHWWVRTDSTSANH
jgi:hypothetical protein